MDVKIIKHGRVPEPQKFAIGFKCTCCNCEFCQEVYWDGPGDEKCEHPQGDRFLGWIKVVDGKPPRDVPVIVRYDNGVIATAEYHVGDGHGICYELWTLCGGLKVKSDRFWTEYTANPVEWLSGYWPEVSDSKIQ